MDHPKCLPELYRRPDLIRFFLAFFDEETVVDHPRKVGYSRDHGFDRMFSLPGNVLYTPGSGDTQFLFCIEAGLADYALIPMALGRARRMKSVSHHRGRPVNFSTPARTPIKKITP